MGWEVGGSYNRERTCVYLWLILFDVWQKPTQHCKAIILHLEINTFLKKIRRPITLGAVLGGDLLMHSCMVTIAAESCPLAAAHLHPV